MRKIGVDPKTSPPDHGAIREAMREIAGQRRRLGFGTGMAIRSSTSP